MNIKGEEKILACKWNFSNALEALAAEHDGVWCQALTITPHLLLGPPRLKQCKTCNDGLLQSFIGHLTSHGLLLRAGLTAKGGGPSLSSVSRVGDR